MVSILALIVPLMFLVLLVMVVLFVVKALFGRSDLAQVNQQHAQQLDQMWRTIDRMEERMANLETILMNKEIPAESEVRR